MQLVPKGSTVLLEFKISIVVSLRRLIATRICATAMFELASP
jgi:hypothetical protein